MTAKEPVTTALNNPALIAPKVVVVMPAFNAGRTLRMTYEALPKDLASSVILVDDGSTDNTVEVARSLGLEIFVHDRNYGYGANQKTCYTEALKANAEIIVMVHPDYQYDPRLLPEMVAPIVRGDADIVLGSRLKDKPGFQPVQDGMPWWKWISNRGLTMIENVTFGLNLSEYHTGYRAYARQVLETCQYEMNADGFIFDQHIIAQAVAGGFRIAETSVPVRYLAESSSASFVASCVYGMKILVLVLRYWCHRTGLWTSPQFVSLKTRYQRLEHSVTRSHP